MYTEDKIKIILEQQAGSRDLSTFTAITREMNGADLKPFTRSTMGVKEEEGCHTDMHKLEDREIWKVLLVRPRWHSEGEQGKEPRALHWVRRARGLLDKGVKGQLATYVVCAAEDPARCSVGTGR